MGPACRQYLLASVPSAMPRIQTPSLRMNVWESPSRNVRVNAKYTHHSCALNPDRNGYDGVGIEVVWTIWRRY